MVERGDHLGRGRDAGDHGHAELAAPLDDAQRSDPGVTTNRAPAVDRLVDLLRPDDRAGADEHVRLGGDAPRSRRRRPPSGR